MARLARLTLPGYPHHVIQRGNNRQAIFESIDDYQTLLELIEQKARKFDVLIHAYVLMSNHFHLLLTPQTSDGMPKMMQAVGRNYVHHFNLAHHRTGTLWEGRYRSTMLQSEHHLLACMAYIDLNPVRAGLAAQAADYPWSSYSHYTGQRLDKLITPHDLVWGLGNTPFAREAAYAELVAAGIKRDQEVALTEALLSGWALGDADFVADLQQKTSRRVAKGVAGRPRAVSKIRSS